MKTKILKIIFCLTICVLSVFSSLAQTLEIHQISVGQGDAGLILIRNVELLKSKLAQYNIPLPTESTGILRAALEKNIPLAGTVVKAVLIDTGEGDRQAQKIKTYLEKVGVSGLDYTIISHYDKDHIGGFISLAQQLLSMGEVWDRGDVQPQPKSKLYDKYRMKIAEKGLIRHSVNNGEKIFLGGWGNQRIELLFTSSNGYVLGENTSISVPRGKPLKDENDLSVSWVLQYGCFRFFSGGDLSGYNAGRKIDIETPLSNAIRQNDRAIFIKSGNRLGQGHVCAFKINHHGSEHSTNEFFLNVFQPITGIISCGYKASYRHPRISTIRLLEPDITPTHLGVPNFIQQYYITSLFKYNNDIFTQIGKSPSKGIIAGDVVLVVDDTNIVAESCFCIFWNGESPGEVVSERNMRTPSEKGIMFFNCHINGNQQSSPLYITE